MVFLYIKNELVKEQPLVEYITLRYCSGKNAALPAIYFK